VLAIGLIIAEAHLPTGGLLGLAGVGALIAGGLLLFDTGSDELSISPGLVVVVAGTLGLGLVFVGHKTMQARRRPVSTGEEELLDSVADVRTPLNPIGQVWVEGALWRARVDGPIGPIEAGCRVRIDEIDGLTLVVTPLKDGSAAAADRTVGGEPEGAS
jgi:membrane-bound serine protease (ClpP class)